MRTIINYIRSMFCKHQFNYEETYITLHEYDGSLIRRGYKISRTCTKCGWHKSYWKY